MTSLSWKGFLIRALLIALFTTLISREGLASSENSQTATQIILVPPGEDTRAALGEFWRVVIDGPIDANSGVVLEKLLRDSNVSAGIVYLNSPGGDVLASLAMGESIRERGLDTFVSRWVGQEAVAGSCLSACVYSFLGGRFRFLPEGSRLAIHRFHGLQYSADDLEMGQAISGEILRYFRSMGVTSEFYERITRVPATTLVELEAKEAVELGVVNNGRLPAEWSIEATDMGVYLRGAQHTVMGLGKVVFSCSPKGVSFMPYIFGGERLNSSIAEGVTSHQITLSERPHEIGGDGSKLFVLQDAVTGSFLLDDAIISEFSAANSVGYVAVLSSEGSRYGFRVDINDSGNLVSNFLRQCIVWRNHLETQR